MSDSDPITKISQLGGDPGLDEPRVFSEESAPPFLQFDGSNVFLSNEPGAPASKKRVKYIPNAQVFVVTEDGNPEYSELLRKGANGEVVLGRKEITDIRSSAAFKVYQEWIEIVRPKREDAEKVSG